MNENNKFSTGFLFATPSFWGGAGTVLNLAGNYYRFNSSDSGLEADEMAIEHDFMMMGQDLKNTIDLFKNENKQLIPEK
jgi:hypothetical protein